MEPPATGAMLAFVAAALAATAGGAALARAAAPRVPPSAARWAAGATALAVAAAGLLAAGVPARMLLPAGWDGLMTGVAQGMRDLPSTEVPYAGVDPWTRSAVLLCGVALLGAGLAAGRAGGGDRRRLLAAVPLLVVAAVPETVLASPGASLRGAALLFLLVAFLRADRLPPRRLPLAAAAVAAAALGGALAAPRLHAGAGWLDYRAIADSLSGGSPATFEWDHRYGPLDWPRDGREVLRVRAEPGAYWKAENLDRFDGFAWRRLRSVGATDPEAELPRTPRRAWVQTLRVTVRGMETSDLVAAGTALAVSHAPHEAVTSGSPGTWRSAAPLRSGNAWLARVYVPRPTPAQLERAGTAYPGLFQQYRTLGMPDGASEVVFPAFGAPGAPSAAGAVPFGTDAVRLLESSPYAGAYRLARRLARASATPYELVRRIERRLAEPPFRYDEDPPVSQVPLATFLRDGRGYCQQFAGAMALLLRMGGVPARAVAGFAPGEYDRARREWVVTDLDAHSWVEAWFPGIGWATFDPTPSAAPALSGPAGRGRLLPTGAADVQGGDPRSDPAARRRAAAARSGEQGLPWAPAAAVVALAGLAGWALARRRRRPDGDRDPLLAELERALRRSGRPPATSTTLRALERRLAAAPQAAGYVAAVSARRYAGGGPPPTAAQRRALRDELGRGLGPLGRLRALWALPPRVRRPDAG
ncbi:MAG: transglutaminase domain-containing protein [Solirubrobacteraceae bacterium]